MCHISQEELGELGKTIQNVLGILKRKVGWLVFLFILCTCDVQRNLSIATNKNESGCLIKVKYSGKKGILAAQTGDN